MSGLANTESKVRKGRVEIRPLAGAVGAEIRGLDLARPLADEDVGTVRAALFEHGVVLFRDQHLTPEQHIAFAGRFGPINVNRFFAHADGYPMIAEVRKEPDQKANIGGGWHTEHSYDLAPALGSVLYARELPPVGGDTLFASMYAAYDALSPRMKAYVEGLTATHDGEPYYRGRYADKGVDDRSKTYPRAVHPVVRTHPETRRRALYVNRMFTTKINDVSREESEAMLAYLVGHCARPEFQVRFRWQAGSVAFWDNRCVQHQALWDYYPAVRSGFRVTVKGDKPV